MINKKIKLNVLTNHFNESWLEFYFQNILSFDLLLKNKNLTIFSILQIIKPHKVSLKIDVSDKLNSSKELSDSLFILNKLTNQKAFLKSDKEKEKVFLILDLRKSNYYKFLHNFSLYIYFFLQKRQQSGKISKLKNKVLNFQFLLLEFYYLINSKYDFLENVLFSLLFKFNLFDNLNLNNSLYNLYLTSLKLN